MALTDVSFLLEEQPGREWLTQIVGLAFGTNRDQTAHCAEERNVPMYQHSRSFRSVIGLQIWMLVMQRDVGMTMREKKNLALEHA
jgi:hypothetical protein